MQRAKKLLNLCYYEKKGCSELRHFKRLILIIIVIAALAGIATFFVKKHEANTAKVETIPTKVVASPVSTTTIDETYSTFGTLAAIQKVTVSSDSDSRVTKIFFKNGQLVSKDTPLIQMDDSNAKAELAVNQANLALAEATYKRNAQLLKYGATTKQNLDQLLAEVVNDKTTVKNSQIALDNLTLKAPFDGQLGAFQINQGDYVSAGDALVTLVSKSPIRVDYSIPQDLAEKLKMKQNVIITAKAIPSQSFNGAVSYISPTVDSDTGTISLQATIANKDGLLSPGMFVQVVEVLGQNDQALVIPDSALLSDIEGNYVYRVDNNRATRANVIIGNIQDGKIEILKGLKKGDSVITQGQQKISDGDEIEAIVEQADNLSKLNTKDSK